LLESPAGGRDAASLTVDIRVRFNPDGSLQAPPQIVGNNRMSDPFYRSAAESARPRRDTMRAV